MSLSSRRISSRCPSPGPALTTCLLFRAQASRPPAGALTLLARVLRPGGTLTVIEGDDGSAYFYPESAAAQEAPATPAPPRMGCSAIPSSRAGPPSPNARNGPQAAVGRYL